MRFWTCKANQEKWFYSAATMWMGPAVTTSRLPQISFTPVTWWTVFLETCLYVCDFEHVKPTTRNDFYSVATMWKGLKLQQSCLPLHFVIKKYEEWQMLAENKQIKLQSCPSCYFRMIQAWMAFHDELHLTKTAPHISFETSSVV
jgi:hypothetical protein